jgi:hypothetical protein
MSPSHGHGVVWLWCARLKPCRRVQQTGRLSCAGARSVSGSQAPAVSLLPPGSSWELTHLHLGRERLFPA